MRSYCVTNYTQWFLQFFQYLGHFQNHCNDDDDLRVIHLSQRATLLSYGTYILSKHELSHCVLIKPQEDCKRRQSSVELGGSVVILDFVDTPSTCTDLVL